MEKKRSVGVILFAIIGFIFSGVQSFIASLFYIYGSLKAVKQTMHPQTAFDYLTYSKYGTRIGEILIVSLIMFFVGLGLMISSVHLFKLKDWARKLFLYLNTILFFISSAFAIQNPIRITTEKLLQLSISLVYCLVFIFFFTRPKVKEQFK